MRVLKNLFYVTVMSLAMIFQGCGGGGSGGGPGSENTAAPYLLSAPQITSTYNSIYGGYDVTVTLEADGPFGVSFVNVWLEDVNDDFNFANLDLVNVGGTTWSGTTSMYLPMTAGTYRVFDIELLDSVVDIPGLGADFRMGWYFYNPQLSPGRYVVDQRHIFNNPEFSMVSFGVSSIPVAQVSVP